MSKSISVLTTSPRQAAMEELMRVPGIGRQVAQDLYDLGFRSVEDLRGQDPQHLYEELCEQQRIVVDRCMLYVFRCAVYYASTDTPDPDLLKWWRWKDVPYPAQQGQQQRQQAQPSHDFAKYGFKPTTTQ